MWEVMGGWRGGGVGKTATLNFFRGTLAQLPFRIVLGSRLKVTKTLTVCFSSAVTDLFLRRVLNVVAMGFPYKAEDKPPEAEATIDQLAEYLDARHAEKYMIFNISEKLYDYGKFHDQVLVTIVKPVVGKPLLICFTQHKRL